PGGEPTLAYPDHVETVDVLGDKARRARDQEIDPEQRAALQAEVSCDAPAEMPVKIGRYQLLEMVGAGGMGMVWGAWDPELERRVALKLVRLTTADSRERMLREGQVLARLSHPNVVPIFDVGVMGGQVYLVMEWVRGTTLRSFVTKAGARREILDAYRQAGEGLAAAHEAGVIHRDFKPDNAIRGEDARVRVLDFGIAAESEANGVAARAAGTPRYMAPEQARGEPVSAASDQYAFCLSLREALDKANDLPGWIAALLTRGSDPDASRRFGSMRELLSALGRDPARRWRRGAIGVAALALSAATFAIGSARTSDAVEPCSGAATELAVSWNPAVRERMVVHLRSLGPLADADRVAGALDDYAKQWSRAHKHACLAHARNDLTLPLYQERLVCLARTRSQLAAVAEVMTTVDSGSLAPALLAARSLPDVKGCADTTGQVVPPPAHVATLVKQITPRVERALVRAAARRSDAIDDARAATAEARTTGYAPLIARALLVEGRAATVNQTDARSLFAEAMSVALRASDDVTAVEAYARWIFELARNGDTQIDNWGAMTEVAARNGRAGRFGRALMYNNLAIARRAADDTEGARKLLQLAQTVAGDASDIELVSISQNLAGLEREPAAATDQLQVARTRLEAALGPNHPEVLLIRVLLASLEPELSRARTTLEEVCRGLERWQQTKSFAHCAYEAAWLADEQDDRAAAAAWMKHVVAHQPGGLRQQTAGSYIAVVESAADRATRIAELARRVAATESSWWWRLAAADALTVIAMTDPRIWQRVVTLLETIDQPLYQRRLARARRMLASTPTPSR
ncbi:MAG TPA: serine/threonine-protein kinase, partial [Kofleriaceae bacterium]